MYELMRATSRWAVLMQRQARQQFIEKFNLRTTPKEKPIMRVEDAFECLKTLWSSREMVFEAEVLRLSLALLMPKHFCSCGSDTCP